VNAIVGESTTARAASVLTTEAAPVMRSLGDLGPWGWKARVIRAGPARHLLDRCVYNRDVPSADRRLHRQLGKSESHPTPRWPTGPWIQSGHFGSPYRSAEGPYRHTPKGLSYGEIFDSDRQARLPISEWRPHSSEGYPALAVFAPRCRTEPSRSPRRKVNQLAGSGHPQVGYLETGNLSDARSSSWGLETGVIGKLLTVLDIGSRIVLVPGD